MQLRRSVVAGAGATPGPLPGPGPSSGPTAANGAGSATWVVTLYEPPRRIEFCIHWRGGLVARLKIAVNPDGDGGSTVRWERLFTALGGHGTNRVQRLEADEVGARMAELDERLRYFLTHGEAQRLPLSRH